MNAPAPRAVSVARESPPRKETAQQSWVPQRPQLPLFRSSADGLALPALRRPDWAPQWLDPFDPSSDLRRWIFPYLLAPWLAAQLLKLALVSPLLEAELHTQGSTFFKLRPEQVEHAEYEAERYRAHLSFEQLMQRAPPLLEADLLTKVRDKLAHDEQELLENNAHSTADLVTDATFSAVVGINVVANIERVRGIQSVVGKEFFSMDSSRQAFLLLLVSDILVGYHRCDASRLRASEVSSGTPLTRPVTLARKVGPHSWSWWRTTMASTSARTSPLSSSLLCQSLWTSSSSTGATAEQGARQR